MEELKVPQCVIDKFKALTELCEKYPTTIPLPVAAKFYGIDQNSLRDALINGSCPFGFGWQHVAGGNRAFCIPTHLFYVCNVPQMAMRNNQLGYAINDTRMLPIF